VKREANLPPTLSWRSGFDRICHSR
jgi:hypothetical protein